MGDKKIVGTFITTADFDLPAEFSKQVLRGILEHHTGQPSWPMNMGQKDIPNGDAAAIAQFNAVRSRRYQLKIEVDVDGNWYVKEVL